MTARPRSRAKAATSSVSAAEKTSPGRVGRVVPVDDLRPGRGLRRERRGEPVAPSGRRRDQDGLGLVIRDEIDDRRPVRREHQHLVARVEERRERGEEALHASVDDDRRLVVGGNAVAVPGLRQDRLPQLRDPRRRRVARLVADQSRAHRGLHGLRRVHPGLAALEPPDLLAGGQQLDDAVPDLDDLRESDALEPAGGRRKCAFGHRAPFKRRPSGRAPSGSREPCRAPAEG